jgi:hypothetical protein
MVAKKKPTPTPAPGTVISHCTFTAEATQCNESTAAAIVALAEASARQADALKEIAISLRGSPGRFETGIRIGGN